MKTVELYFDFSSPNAYFAAMLLPAIAERTGARIEYRPFFLGGLFKLIGGPDTPGMTSPEKAQHSQADLLRWSRKHAVPFRFPSRFPLNTVKALRAVLVASEVGLEPAKLIEVLFRAYWVDDRDISDRAVLGEIASALGGDAEALAQRIEDPLIKDRLRAETEKARERGVFGAPVCIVEDELFFGKDRLDFVEDQLRS